MSDVPGETSGGSDDGVTVGCWLDTPNGEAVCVGVDGGKVLYRYSAVPFRDGKPQVLEQLWVLVEERLRRVRFLYPQNVVSAEVVKLRGPYGKGEPVPAPPEDDVADPVWSKSLTTSTSDDDFN